MTNPLNLSEATEKALYQLSDALVEIKIASYREIQKIVDDEITAYEHDQVPTHTLNIHHAYKLATDAEKLRMSVDVISGRVPASGLTTPPNSAWASLIQQVLGYKDYCPELEHNVAVELILSRTKPAYIELQAKMLEQLRDQGPAKG